MRWPTADEWFFYALWIMPVTIAVAGIVGGRKR